jgi:3-methyl-2-oxobutanoate hydroxymethyltransferase
MPAPARASGARRKKLTDSRDNLFRYDQRRNDMAKKKMIHDFVQMKKDRDKITFLTAYDYPTAQFAEAAGLDMLLVGDSLGMCVYGYSGTVPVVMNQCIYHCDAVRRGAPNTFVVGDMPFMSYQSSLEMRAAS